MKKLLFLFTFSICLLPFAFAQEYGWQDISENIPEFPDDTLPRTLTDVYFINDDEGWITTNLYGNDTSFILHTIDGGETFELQTTEYTTNAIHMLNENEGYAGGRSGFVYRTTDGGENWTHHGSIGTNLADISFPPVGDTGYCCGLNGNIHSITSEGTEKMTSNINGNVNSLSFPLTSEEGWVCGGDVIRHYKNGVWNGDQDYPSGGYNALFMLDNLNGWAVGDGGIIIHTEDGMNWSEQTNQQGNSLFDVYFLDLNNGWSIGSGGTIVQTADDGTTWTLGGTGLTTNFLTGIHFTSPTNGYVVGVGKTLLKYTEVSGIGEDTQAIEFELFPNPVSDKFEVRSAEFGVDAGKVELYAVSGKKVLEEKIKKGQESIEIDVNHLESGMYLCKITIGKRSSTKKIVKE